MIKMVFQCFSRKIKSTILSIIGPQDKFHNDVKTHSLAVFDTDGKGGARLASRVHLLCAPGRLTFTPRLLLVHLGRYSVLSRVSEVSEV